nr:PREDICTED: methyltransferase-like protein 22 isoform X2 [Latimeria chalumnae]|eukprot:XP_014351597.1 PREDICTED: methyltransferase-like protein 22 isoform X2 [Latimeria chalumnae]
MDAITFKSDTVLSDVHLLMPNRRHLLVRLNAAGQPVFVSRFKILSNNDRCESEDEFKYFSEGLSTEAKTKNGEDSEKLKFVSHTEKNDAEKWNQQLEDLVDDDGDLDVVRRPHSIPDVGVDAPWREKVYPTILSKGEEFNEDNEDHDGQDTVRIEHTMATPLEDVGKQVWRGALLLADYILHNCFLFKKCTALDLGTGTGITSIIMATVAKTVYSTGGLIKVKELDWLRDEFNTDPEVPYSWSEEEIADLHDHTSVLLAADVCYDDELTDALFRTVYKIMSNLRKPSTLYVSIEKRFNFTLRQLDITCEAYDHFRSCLTDLANITDGKTKFTVVPIKLAFPQFLVYERVEQLELWKVTADPVI